MNRYSGIADKLITDSAQKASRYDKAFMLTERYRYLPIRTPTGIASLDTCLGCFDKLSDYEINVTGECHKELVTVLSDCSVAYDNNYIYIDCSDMSAKDIYDCMNAMIDRYIIRPVVVVDYLQRLNPSKDNYSGSGAENIAIDENIHILRKMAVDND